MTWFFCYYKADPKDDEAMEAAHRLLVSRLAPIASLKIGRKFAPGQLQADPSGQHTWLQCAELPDQLTPELWEQRWHEASQQSGLPKLLKHGQHIEWFHPAAGDSPCV